MRKGNKRWWTFSLAGGTVATLVAIMALVVSGTSSAAATFDRLGALSAFDDECGEENLSEQQSANDLLEGNEGDSTTVAPVRLVREDCEEEEFDTSDEGEGEFGICDAICKLVFGNTFPRPGGGTCYYRRCYWTWHWGGTIWCVYLCSVGESSQQQQQQ